MFGLFKKEAQSKIRVMGHDLEVVSITRGGKVLFTGEAVRKFSKNHLEGKIFEVAFICRSGNPYFAYYICPDYYHSVVVAGRVSVNEIKKAMQAEKFRSAVSQAIGAFLVKCLKDTLKMNAGREIVSFSHNRAHTNVLAYIPSMSRWAPIQHNDAEGDDASERKAASVDSGRAELSDVIAVNELSPSA